MDQSREKAPGPSLSGTWSSIDYYDLHHTDFVSSTVDVDMGCHQARFLALLSSRGPILDLGCGSGRDSLAFLRAGYSITSVDGSQAMVDATTALTGQSARRLRFDQLDFVEEFDGIWACASLLHVPRVDLGDIMTKVLRALRSGGVLYVSFKVGESERFVDGRHFTDFTLASFEAWVAEHKTGTILELWETSDVREGRSDEGWVNAILRKN